MVNLKILNINIYKKNQIIKQYNYYFQQVLKLLTNISRVFYYKSVSFKIFLLLLNFYTFSIHKKIYDMIQEENRK